MLRWWVVRGGHALGRCPPDLPYGAGEPLAPPLTRRGYRDEYWCEPPRPYEHCSERTLEISIALFRAQTVDRVLDRYAADAGDACARARRGRLTRGGRDFTLK